MPADDTYSVAHHKTVRGPEHRAGCFDRQPFLRGYWATDRKFFDDGRWALVPVFIPHTMSTNCRGGVLTDLAECVGCDVEQDIAEITDGSVVWK